MPFPDRAAAAIDRVTIAIGRSIAWAALAMVLVQFALVVLRYAFGIGSIAAQEAVVWAHGALFLLAAPYAFAIDAHVRVDVFYRTAGPRQRAAIDLAGAMLLLLPVSAAIFWAAWPYAAASWASLEGSRETSGLAGVYLQKTLILLFAGLLFLQGLALAARNAVRLAAPPTFDPAGPGGR
jgi:TRAP-type mannitol/chloroaromatic compound transport system permease small subunit